MPEKNKRDDGVLEGWAKSIMGYFAPAQGAQPGATSAQNAKHSASVMPEVPKIVPVIPGIDGESSFQDSENIVSGQRAYFGANGESSLLLDDPRLNTAYERMMKEYHLVNDGHKLSPRDRERALAEAATGAIQDEYGIYNQSVANSLEKQNSAFNSFKSGKISQSERDETVTKLRQNENALEDYHFKLSEVPKGTLVCRQRAAVLSYLMQKAGVPNYMVTGVVSDDQSKSLDGHVWVLSKQTGDVWESTDTNSSGYRKNVQNLSVNEIIAGVPVITGGDYGVGIVYGTGFRNIPAQKNVLKDREQGKSEECFIWRE